MNDQMISWLLVAEFSLPFIILSVVLGLILKSNSKKYKEASRALIAKIKSNEDTEQAALKAFLTGKLGIEEGDAKSFSKKILNERKFFFRNLISGLLDKNLEALVALEDDLSRVTKQYHDLPVNQTEPQESPQPTEPVEQPSDNDEQLKALKAEIKSLKHEVHITLTTLNNLFGEFSSMFGETVPDKEMTVEQIITAMEAFANKGAEDLAELSPEETSEEDGEVDDAKTADSPDSVSEQDDDAADVEQFTENSEPSGESASESENSESEEQTNEAQASEKQINEEQTNEELAEEAEKLQIDDELDDIESALDELELGSGDEEEPSWDDAFAESGDKPDEK